MAQAKYSVNCI